MGKVEKFLETYKSVNTRKTYRMALADFLKSVYGKAEDLEIKSEQYFKEERDVKKDVEAFFLSIRNLAPKSVRLKLAAVKVFLIENDVELSQKFWRRVRRKIKGNRALTLDKVPSNVELRKIVMHLPIQGKALFLTLASSGMRIGEALQLKLEDVELDEQPGKVNIRGDYTKTGNSRVAFISEEAKMTVKEWLKVRSDYLDAASKKSHLYDKDANDSRLFPFENTTAYSIWNTALKKAGFAKRDASTNRRRIHPHVLRKFFRTKMGTIIPVDVAEALMGHEEYLTEVYRRYSMEDLARFYLQGEPALLVFTEAEEVSRLRVEVEERNKQLQTLMNGLVTENLNLKTRINKTEERLAKMEKLIHEALKETS